MKGRMNNFNKIENLIPSLKSKNLPFWFVIIPSLVPTIIIAKAITILAGIQRYCPNISSIWKRYAKSTAIIPLDAGLLINAFNKAFIFGIFFFWELSFRKKGPNIQANSVVPKSNSNEKGGDDVIDADFTETKD